MQWDDFNIDLTASFRRFREQVLNAPSSVWASNSGIYIKKCFVFYYNCLFKIDTSTVNPINTNSWGHDLFPNGEANSFFESIKLASSGEISWNEIDVKPYCGK